MAPKKPCEPDQEPLVPSTFSDRLNRALMQLGLKEPDEQYRRFLNDFQKARKEGEPFQLDLPGWEDVIDTRPPPIITSEDRLLHNRALRAGQPSPLSRRKAGEIEKKKRIIERFANSPTSEFAKGLSTVLTMIDDANDLIGTIALIGRLVIPPRTALGKRAIPALNALLTVKALTDTLQLLARIPLGGLAGKRQMLEALQTNPFGRKARLKRLKKIYRRYPSIGELLEALQTTDQLFGVGISLGPIFGTATDTMFAVNELTKGEPVTVRVPLGGGLPLELQFVLSQFFPDITPPKLAVTLQAPIFQKFPDGVGERILLAKAFRLMTGAWMTGQIRNEMDPPEMIKVLLGINLAQKLIQNFFPGFEWGDLLDPHHDTPAAAPSATDQASLQALQELGIDPIDTATWPLKDNPTAVTTDQVVNQLLPTLLDSPRQFFLSHPPSEQISLYLALVNKAALEAMYTNDGSRENVDCTFTLEAFLLAKATQWGITPPPCATFSEIGAWVNTVKRAHARDNLSFPNKDILQNAADALWGGAALRALRTAPP